MARQDPEEMASKFTHDAKGKLHPESKVIESTLYLDQMELL